MRSTPSTPRRARRLAPRRPDPPAAVRVTAVVRPRCSTRRAAPPAGCPSRPDGDVRRSCCRRPGNCRPPRGRHASGVAPGSPLRRPGRRQEQRRQHLLTDHDLAAGQSVDHLVDAGTMLGDLGEGGRRRDLLPWPPCRDRARHGASAAVASGAGSGPDGGGAAVTMSVLQTVEGAVEGGRRVRAKGAGPWASSRRAARRRAPACSAARARSRCGAPKSSSSAPARLKYRCASCSQVMAMPPCSWIATAAADVQAVQRVGEGEQRGDGGLVAAAPQTGLLRRRAPTPRSSIALRAASTATWTSANRCLTAWNAPIARPNCCPHLDVLDGPAPGTARPRRPPRRRRRGRCLPAEPGQHRTGVTGGVAER